MTFTVSYFQAHENEEWLDLWSAYLDRSSLVFDYNLAHANWRRFFDPASALEALALKATDQDNNNSIAGFAVLLFHENSGSDRLECYLHDLYVDENWRKHGGGHLLLSTICDMCRARDIFRLSWTTSIHNEVAQSLYKHFAEPQNRLRYRAYFDGELE